MAPVIVLAASFLVTWVYVLILVPSQVESLFRHRLWRVRDELQDHILDGKISDLPVIQDIIDLVEGLIEHSQEIRLAHYVAMKIARRRFKTENKVPLFQLSSLSPPERDFLNGILDELYRSLLFKLVAGSRAGAFLLPIWLLYFRPQSQRLAEPHTEFRRLQRVHYFVKNSGRQTDLLASVG